MPDRRGLQCFDQILLTSSLLYGRPFVRHTLCQRSAKRNAQLWYDTIDVPWLDRLFVARIELARWTNNCYHGIYNVAFMLDDMILLTVAVVILSRSRPPGTRTVGG